MKQLGVMQGRLTDKGGFFPQQFPWNNWEQEFETAAHLGIHFIEWMFNYEEFFVNPLWKKDGLEKIRKCSENSGASVRSVCANYFMQEGLFRKTYGVDVTERLMSGMEQIGADILVIPMFEDNEPGNSKETAKFREALCKVLLCAKKHGVTVALESDWEALYLVQILNDISEDNLGICYDVGNAAGLGKDIIKELEILKDKLVEIHIKDKPSLGKTVMLGEGAVPFQELLKWLERQNFDGPLILESFYGVNSIDDTKVNIAYVESMLY